MIFKMEKRSDAERQRGTRVSVMGVFSLMRDELLQFVKGKCIEHVALSLKDTVGPPKKPCAHDTRHSSFPGLDLQ